MPAYAGIAEKQRSTADRIRKSNKKDEEISEFDFFVQNRKSLHYGFMLQTGKTLPEIVPLLLHIRINSPKDKENSNQYHCVITAKPETFRIPFLIKDFSAVADLVPVL